MWDDERVALLRKLWKQESARSIASKLGGTTRNAVIGKARRLGLSRISEPERVRRWKASNPAIVSGWALYPRHTPARRIAPSSHRAQPAPQFSADPASQAAKALLSAARAAERRCEGYRHAL